MQNTWITVQKDGPNHLEMWLNDPSLLSFWIPQIAHNALKDLRRPVSRRPCGKHGLAFSMLALITADCVSWLTHLPPIIWTGLQHVGPDRLGLCCK